MKLVCLTILLLLNTARSYPCSNVDGSELTAALVHSLTTAIVGASGNGWLMSVFWDLYASLGERSDLMCYVEMVNKNLREYHVDRIITTMKGWNRKFEANENNLTELQKLLDEFELPNNIAWINGENLNTRAALYPMVFPWCTLHLNLYQQIIKLKSLKDSITTLESDMLMKDSDKWLIFYSKIMIRFHREHRYKIIEWMKMKDTRKSDIMKHGSELMQPWRAYAFENSTKTALNRMIDSCRLKSGATVSFKYSKGKWLSCWVSGSDCTWRSCPVNYMDFGYSNKYGYGYQCRGEVFWIYSSGKWIDHKDIVNIQYSSYSDQSFWLSKARVCLKYSIALYSNMPDWSDCIEKGYDTKTCPGKTFKGISDDCGSENFKIREIDQKTNSFIYDGSIIQLGPEQPEVEIFINGAESNNRDLVQYQHKYML